VRPGLAAGHAPHDLRRRRADPVSDAPATKVAVVTGGGSGIGLAVSERLAADGIAVAVLDRDGAAADAAATQLVAAGGRSLGLAADVTDRAAVEAAVAE